ncbi:MAG: ferritin [Methylomonas sp.]|nr:MAG: ferritin [Methylomonas sp.]
MSNAGHQGPTEELSNENRDMHQATVSLMEELEAINNYNQRANACADKALKAIFEHNRDEEKEHAAMLLEWIRRQDPNFSSKLQTYLFSDKPITHSTAAD